MEVEPGLSSATSFGMSGSRYNTFPYSGHGLNTVDVLFPVATEIGLSPAPAVCALHVFTCLSIQYFHLVMYFVLNSRVHQNNSSLPLNILLEGRNIRRPEISRAYFFKRFHNRLILSSGVSYFLFTVAVHCIFAYSVGCKKQVH